ncbi:maleylacetoacetate isomerase [uncultured Parvibaculum sp.]|uniref:maleylacetoacetate isomerase n=1 Tax=uncultured Parvibaculum sp. TaxID=291828 RepID=UPI0030D705BB
MRLITRWRNSAGERVRIALRLKGVPFDYVPVDEMGLDEYRRLNPQGLLPALDMDGRVIAQSVAILAFLEEEYPEPALLPDDPMLRAEARAFAAHIASEMHALTVKRIGRFLNAEYGVDEAGLTRWQRHWMAEGFTALEEALARRDTEWPFCFGETPGWADLHLVPQMRNARRFGCDLSAYKRLNAIDARCNEMEAFTLSRPEMQMDWPGEGAV